MKKIKIIATIGIFLLSFLSHYIYHLLPNTLFSILFPVNESIFEHLKIIYTSTLLYGIIDYILLKTNKIKFSNFLLQLFLTSFLGIFLYLTLYLPINNLIGEYLPLSILLLLIVYAIMQILSYFLLKAPKINISKQIIIVLIILIYIIFAVLTYHPPHTKFFLDKITNTYGINPLTKK